MGFNCLKSLYDILVLIKRLIANCSIHCDQLLIIKLTLLLVQKGVQSVQAVFVFDAAAEFLFVVKCSITVKKPEHA